MGKIMEVRNSVTCIMCGIVCALSILLTCKI